jgi:hypothetical protein
VNGACWNVKLLLECARKCVSAHKDNYYCWRSLAADPNAGKTESSDAAKHFLDLVETAHPDHPFIPRAQQLAGLTSPSAERARPAPASPEKR